MWAGGGCFNLVRSISTDNRAPSPAYAPTTSAYIPSNLSIPCPVQFASSVAGPSGCGPRLMSRSSGEAEAQALSAQSNRSPKLATSAKENYPFLAQLFSKDTQSPSQPLSPPPGLSSFPKAVRPGLSVLSSSNQGNSASSTAPPIRLAPIRPLFSQARSAGNGSDGLDMGAIKSREFHFSAAGSARREAMFSTGGSEASSSDAEQEVDGPMNPPRHPSAA